MKYHQLNIQQKYSAIDQIVEILNNRKVTRESVEWVIVNFPETAAKLFAIDIVDEKTVLVSRKR